MKKREDKRKEVESLRKELRDVIAAVLGAVVLQCSMDAQTSQPAIP